MFTLTKFRAVSCATVMITALVLGSAGVGCSSAADSEGQAASTRGCRNYGDAGPHGYGHHCSPTDVRGGVVVTHVGVTPTPIRRGGHVRFSASFRANHRGFQGHFSFALFDEYWNKVAVDTPYGNHLDQKLFHNEHLGPNEHTERAWEFRAPHSLRTGHYRAVVQVYRRDWRAIDDLQAEQPVEVVCDLEGGIALTNLGLVPRQLRQGDYGTLSATVEAPSHGFDGHLTFAFFDAHWSKIAMLNAQGHPVDQSRFEHVWMHPNERRTFSWHFRVPRHLAPGTYRAVAQVYEPNWHHLEHLQAELGVEVEGYPHRY